MEEKKTNIFSSGLLTCWLLLQAPQRPQLVLGVCLLKSPTHPMSTAWREIVEKAMKKSVRGGGEGRGRTKTKTFSRKKKKKKLWSLSRLALTSPIYKKEGRGGGKVFFLLSPNCIEEIPFSSSSSSFCPHTQVSQQERKGQKVLREGKKNLIKFASSYCTATEACTGGQLC